jgi:hypothetical protein
MSVGDPQSFNRYAYVENDPTNRIDPSGLYALLDGVSHGIGGFHYGPDGVYGGYFGDPNIIIFRGNIGKEGHRRLEIYGDMVFFLDGPHPYRPSSNRLRNAVADCAYDNFGVTLTDFKPSSPGNPGSFTGTNLNSDPRVAQIHIENEVRSYSSRQLGKLLVKFGGHTPGKGRGVAGLTIDFKTANGAETGYSPYRNFTARDANKFVGQIAGIDNFVETQIHELGNSLDLITGIYIGDPALSAVGGDSDSGFAFETCVKTKLEGGN